MDKYRIDGRLGSAKNVFRVTRVVDGAQFIMKRIALSHLDAAGVRQAKLEFGLATRLHHPGVARSEEAFLFDEDNMCIIMPYYGRGDLSTFIARRIRNREHFLDEDFIMRWFINIVLALHYLHSHNIVHRDVKSSNIFLEGPADSDAAHGVVLGDFGIAQIQERLPGGAIRSPRGDDAVSGTPQNMAPELLERGNSHTFRSDIWALGCVLYEMLCYRHPFESTDVSRLVVKVIQGNFAPLPRRYSREMCELVVRLLDVNPASRPLIDDVLDMPFVQAHVKRFYAAVVARGAFASMTPSSKQNLIAQMSALRANTQPQPPGTVLPSVVPPLHVAVGNHAGARLVAPPAHSSRHSVVGHTRTASMSPDRGGVPLLHGSPRSDTESQISGPSHGRRAGAPALLPSPLAMDVQRTSRASVASSAAISAYQPVPHLAQSRNSAHSSAPFSPLTATSSSRRSMSETEMALYEAAREHDSAFVRLKDAQRRGLHGQGISSVKDTVDRVVYGPPAQRVAPRTHDGTDGVAGFFT
jgi:serine/threonine protein kinase